MTSSLAHSAQRLLEQPLLPLDLSYSTLYGIYTGANTFNPSALQYPATTTLPIKIDPQDVENKMPFLSDYPLNTSSGASLGLLDCSTTILQSKLDNHLASNASDSDGCLSSTSYCSNKSKSGGEKRKKELIRDQAYWERRRKNNDAAKRSRDSRRKKEDEVAVRAALLEQENLRLRFEVERLKTEIERHRVVALNSKILINPSFESLARIEWDRAQTLTL
ncbi:unnamed protein product [Bursaphelenchus xylophilus]|uniref:(pine wood nematode) hypothetical protein n=1 Tax=Bursaphelenchus xylophilus TaxID=6326 RepID=A0A1I7RS01_BURXY|nr:unnamed protein product [Bursaphelenchus xylophilus]CAG9123351.1 unnamed protein product [Bursaphelenchus xylophilus]